ncbi:nitric oxide-associated protein 1 isoform X2 [Neoarius graeffei]|uniref:nitric oxide-associated protein 1 isoform X2 n=1 Tax=Neoarius graeffei TaxID=443677 RepID=UPI00298CBF12|nr:nitric oxide-associated protein 1 isoform X2 [Neoarius graeffei]
MSRFLQVPVFRFPASRGLKCVLMTRDQQSRGLKWRHLSQSSLYFDLVSKSKQQTFWISDSWTSMNGALRFHSTEEKSKNRPQATPETYSSVEPDKEEDFVFLDYCEPKDHEENPFPEQFQITDSMKAQEDKPRRKTVTELQQKALELQLRSLKDVGDQSMDLEDCIDFHDVGFPLERSRKKKTKQEQKIYGSPDAEMPISDVSCSGCGALMHCMSPEVPGYLPSEKYKQLIEEDKLKKAICQRCFLLTHHQKALNITMSKDEYRKIVSRIKSEKALVLLIVDLLDLPDSIVLDLPRLVGGNKHIVVLGNKVDLLPGDSQNYLQRIRKQLVQYCTDAGIPCRDSKDVHLISAKTGYGIENLITMLQASWKYKGDVYLVGTANAGKSTLFNTLLESDYCKSRASDVIRKATISPWPGTTLNLLKFPIINPTPYRMFRRAERLRLAAQQTEDDLDPEELKRIQHFRKQGYLIGRVGRTFRVQTSRNDLVEFDPDSLSVGEDLNEDNARKPNSEDEPEAEFTYNEIKDAHWFYDTPGIMKERDILSLLNEQEVKLVVPTHAITPRTFLLKPGMVLFLGALARIDYLEGNQPCWFTVVASSQIPVHITSLDKADLTYQKHAGQTLLAVPTGGEERMKMFPAFVSQDFELEGRGLDTAVTDIKLSSAGWIAVTAPESERLLLRSHASPPTHRQREGTSNSQISGLQDEKTPSAPGCKSFWPTTEDDKMTL